MNQKQRATDVRRQFPCIAAEDPVTIKALEKAAGLAGADMDILIIGETGVGKEMLAQGIHALSRRAGGPFIAIDVSTFPETTIEAELFGHEKGAYTGADTRFAGRVMAAHRGTLFLDEIGHLSRPVQVKLLRLLQEKKVHRLGKAQAVSVDARVIAATDRDLARMVKAGTFEKSLYFRFHQVIELPPLRERRADIAALVEWYRPIYNRKYRKHVRAVSPEALGYLQRQPWPGNARQLVHALEAAVFYADARQRVLEVEDFKSSLRIWETADEGAVSPGRVDGTSQLTYDQILERVVRDRLEQFQGNKTKAAESLGVSRNTFRAWCEKYRLGLDE
jgi:transcriptional regulator with PAS, ATPase and Fis domain